MSRLIVFDVYDDRRKNQITIAANLLSHHICFDGYRILMCVNLDFKIKMCNGWPLSRAGHNGIVCVAGWFENEFLLYHVLAFTVIALTNYCLIRPIFNDHCMGASLAKPHFQYVWTRTRRYMHRSSFSLHISYAPHTSLWAANYLYVHQWNSSKKGNELQWNNKRERAKRWRAKKTATTTARTLQHSFSK